MRNNQVSIRIQRFGDEIPKNFKIPEDDILSYEYKNYKEGTTQIIKTYADSNNLYEALVAAFNEAVMEIQKYEDLPKFDIKEHYD